MSVIRCDNVSRVYKIPRQTAGLNGFLKGLIFPEYGEVKALSSIDFTVDCGEIIGVVGPNGAGKSTLIKIITGIMPPSSGSVLTFDKNPVKHRIANNQKLGVCFGHRSQLIWDLPVIDSFEMLKSIYKIDDSVYSRNLGLFEDHFNNHKELFNTPVRQLSLGQRVACDILASFLHDPELLILDEPTIGLDFLVREKILHLIKKLNKEVGTTIIFTSHNLFDVEKLCEKIVVLDKGRKIFDRPVNDIKSLYANESELILDEYSLKSLKIKAMYIEHIIKKILENNE